MDNETGTVFRQSSLSDQIDMVLQPELRSELIEYLGQSAYDDFSRLAASAQPSLRGKHLARNLPPDVLIVPGVMGSLLASTTLGGLWWLDLGRDLKRLNDLGLDAAGCEDLNPEYEIDAIQIDMHYTAILEAALKHPDFGYDSFFYDWRKSPLISGDRFLEKIRSLYARNGHRPIHIIAHSMGGLVVRASLARHADELWPMVGRLVFIGTPHYGSSVIGAYLKNHLGGSLQMLALGRLIKPSVFRSLWGPLAMLPAPTGIYPGTRENPQAALHPCADFDLYDLEQWGLQLDPAEDRQLAGILAGTKELHRLLFSTHASFRREQRERMAVIVGVGMKTLFSVSVKQGLGNTWDRLFPDVSRDPSNPHREGDGRVPVASAALEGVGDTRYVRGVHDALPNMQVVYEDAFRWIRGEEMMLSRSIAGALGSHLSASGYTSAVPNLDGSIYADTTSDDPGYLDFSPAVEDEVASYERGLWAGSNPEFRFVRIL